MATVNCEKFLECTMNRLFEIQEHLNELMKMDPSELADCRYLEDYSDDIIRKLVYLRQSPSTLSFSHTLSLSSHSPPRSPRTTRCMITPPSSVASCSSGDFSDFHDVSLSARKAFDNEIYSRCIQIVENAARNGDIDCSLISLAHNSYISMVEHAEDSTDTKKYLQWWNTFLESIDNPRRPICDRIEIFDYRTQSLERQYSIDGTRKRGVACKLIEVLSQVYQLTTSLLRPFHSKSIRRLERLVLWTAEVEQLLKDSPEIIEAHETIQKAVERTGKDRERYRRETGANDRDAEFSLCSKILDDLLKSQGFKEKFDLPPMDDTIDELLSKVFPNGSLPTAVSTVSYHSPLSSTLSSPLPSPHSTFSRTLSPSLSSPLSPLSCTLSPTTLSSPHTLSPISPRSPVVLHF